MKLELFLRKKSRIGILLCAIFLMVYQGPLHADTPKAEAEEILLEEAFQLIGQKFGVFFNYDQVMVNNVSVLYDEEEHETLDAALDDVLGQADLKFQIFDKQYVAVYRDTEEGVESLKKMIVHFQSIVDKKELEHKRKSRLVDRLGGHSFDELHLKRLVLNVTGRVVDTNGEPLIGVNILVKGSNLGTATDVDGRFSFSDIADQAILLVSYIGYRSQEVAVNGQTSLTIVMQEDVKTLDEVVVVGYGTQKKVNLTGAISTLDGDDLARRQVGQSSMLLQGVAPGVVVTQRFGQPGKDGGAISIRGKTTLGNSNPLILVDGVERNINSVDPSSIESISVLKDAASSAIYGSRASAGVILVTTKRAKDSDRVTVSYNSYFGKQTPIDLPDMVGAIDHMLLTNEAYVNTGRSQLYSDDFIEEYRNNMATNPDKYPNTDWYDEVLTGNGYMQNHFLSFSGGTKSARFSASLGYLDQNGIMENTNYKRYTFDINSDLVLAKGLSAKLDAHIVQNDIVDPTRGTSAAIHWAGRIPANQGGRLSDGSWGEGWNGDNPIAFTRDGGLRKSHSPTAVLNLGLIYDPKDWLSMNFYYSPHYWQSNTSAFNKSIQTYGGDGSLSYKTPQRSTNNTRHSRSLTNNLRGTVTLSETFGSHNISFLAGYQQEDFRSDDFSGYREKYAFPDYPVLSSGGEENQRASGGASEWALQSVFGRLNYNFNEKYLLEGNFRYDGSSRFAKGNKWGVFPSFSAGWRISEESFFESAKDVVDNLKIRASWGKLGNQRIGTYPFSSDINLGLSYVFNNQIVDGAGITSLANREISWETTTASNLGLDVTVFNRFNLVAEYFYKVTDDILLALDIPLTVGLSAPDQNAGKVENRGWELGLNYGQWDKEFKYEIGFNLSDVKNKILDLKGITRSGTTVNHEGHEMHSIYGLEAAGLIQESDFDSEGNYNGPQQYGAFGAGDIKYVDQNGDGVIDANDYKIIGGTIPRLTFGLNFNAEYRDFDFSIFLQGVGKANGLIRNQGIMPFFLGGTVQEQHKDRWTPDNINSTFPRFAFNETNNEKVSSFWMKNAAYGRVKNVQLGYSIPPSLLFNGGFQKLRVYFSGQNIFTLENFWDGYDVEAPVGSGGYYPQVKTYSFGIDIRF
ncbi:TonB-dependent receptor [Membranicola marinus]|uniref:TonB-dependent receptor n=1 Tax=Membranihabitans marinus TaxID=1227546 RepID=A0A953LC55_9BACT|nr:TonB-dependent receptor [Membranihabitans marinus]MBY5959186.1 TonB-dependent receptor [Membranihabitans marinus]